MEFANQEHLQDFLEESKDILQSMTRSLLALESGTAGTDAAPLLDEVFRRAHTLKGLSGMVGLTRAEGLAHAMESVLRAVQSGRLSLSSTTIDVLLDSSATFEGLINTLRQPGAAEPDVGPVLNALRDLEMGAGSADASGARPETSQPEGAIEPGPSILSALPVEVAQALNPSDWRRLHGELDAGRSLFLITFTPSSERAALGINVNSVRERLQAQGEVLKSVPLISERAVRFSFLLAAERGPEVRVEDGVEWRPLGTPDREATSPAKPGPGKGEMSAMPAFVRVELDRLDEIMRMVGELMVSRSRLEAALPALEAGGAPSATLVPLRETSDLFGRNLRHLREAVMRTRLVPLSEVFGRMPLVVRDLARAERKDVALVLEGEETEIDKLLVERLMDPMLHLVRNAIVHGIETPVERRAAGKPPQGRLTLRGEPEGDRILVTVSDDGRGVEVDKVSSRARAIGLIGPEETLGEDDLLEVLSRPGFSTRSEADLGAGRGVGMDIVRRAVSALGGTLAMRTTLQRGTTFALRLPLTLAIMDAFLVEVGGETFAVPTAAVNEAIEINPTQIVRAEFGEMIPFRDGGLPILHLSRAFHLPDGNRRPRTAYGLLVGEDGGRVALVVDRLIGLREIVVRALVDPLVARPGIAAATELGDGRVVLILDVPRLLGHVRRGAASPSGAQNR